MYHVKNGAKWMGEGRWRAYLHIVSQDCARVCCLDRASRVGGSGVGWDWNCSRFLGTRRSYWCGRKLAWVQGIQGCACLRVLVGMGVVVLSRWCVACYPCGVRYISNGVPVWSPPLFERTNTTAIRGCWTDVAQKKSKISLRRGKGYM